MISSPQYTERKCCISRDNAWLSVSPAKYHGTWHRVTLAFIGHLLYARGLLGPEQE